MLAKIYFLAFVLGRYAIGSLLEPPPEVICSLLCKDDFVTDIDNLIEDDAIVLEDFHKLVENWRSYFDSMEKEKQQHFCWHYVDFDHCLRHCASDPKLFIPVKLEPLEIHCEPFMTRFVTSIQCLGQFHKSIESNCNAYANSIKMAAEKWTKEENVCKLLSQHLDCLTINAEFYCGRQIAEKKFFIERFHSLITRGNDYWYVRKLLIDCFNRSSLEPRKKKFMSWQSENPSNVVTLEVETSQAYHKIHHTFPKSPITFGIQNKTGRLVSHTQSEIENEKSVDPHLSKLVSESISMKPFALLLFLCLVATVSQFNV